MIAVQRVNPSELYIRFVGGQEYHRTRDELVAMLEQERGDKTRTENRCLTELRAIVGSLADEIVVELEADGTPRNVSWYEPGYRTRLEDAGLLPRRR